MVPSYDAVAEPPVASDVVHVNGPLLAVEARLPGERGHTFDVRRSSDVRSLAGDMAVRYGCPAARVGWRVDVDGDVLASGTFGEGRKRTLTSVAVRPRHPLVIVTITAARLDSAGCETEFSWHNPGFEGPGNGRFRFVLPFPDTA